MRIFEVTQHLKLIQTCDIFIDGDDDGGDDSDDTDHKIDNNEDGC